jgi:hypothetical protein
LRGQIIKHDLPMENELGNVARIGAIHVLITVRVVQAS